MRKILSVLILLLCTLPYSNLLRAQRAYTLQDFKTELVDTVSLPKERYKVDFNVPKSPEGKLWQVYNDGKRTISRPLYHKGVVFPANGLKYAFDAKTGEKIHYGSKEAKERFKEWDSPYVCIREFGNYSTVPSIIDIMSGQVINKSGFEERSFEAHLVKETTLIMDQGQVKLISLPNKSVLWEKEDVFGRGAIIGENFVFLSNKRGDVVYAYDKTSGEECWSLNLEDELLMTFKLNENFLYIGTTDGIYSIDVSKQNEPVFKWKYANYALDITFDANRIYVFNERPYAINKHNGHIEWKSEGYFPPDVSKLSVTENYLIGRGHEPESAASNTVIDKHTGKLLGNTYEGEYPGVPADTYYAEFGQGDTLYGMANENQIIIAVKLDYAAE